MGDTVLERRREIRRAISLLSRFQPGATFCPQHKRSQVILLGSEKLSNKTSIAHIRNAVWNFALNKLRNRTNIVLRVCRTKMMDRFTNFNRFLGIGT